MNQFWGVGYDIAERMKFASSFAPRTPAGIFFRNQVTRLMGVPLVADLVIGRAMRDDIELPQYALRSP